MKTSTANQLTDVETLLGIRITTREEKRFPASAMTLYSVVVWINGSAHIGLELASERELVAYLAAFNLVGTAAIVKFGES